MFKNKGILVLLALVMVLTLGSAFAQESDTDYIVNKGKLTIGITLYAPINYYEGDTLVGFDTDFAKAVCEKLGVEADFVEINWDSKEIELNAKNIDCIWNGLTITDERKENMGISVPYLKNAQVLVYRGAEDSTVEGKNVVAEAGSTGEKAVLNNALFNASTFIPVDSQAKALMEVKAQTADVAVVDSICAYVMVGENTDYSTLKVDAKNDFGAENYGIAFRKGSDLLDKVNDIIAQLTEDGTMLEIAQKYGLQDMLCK